MFDTVRFRLTHPRVVLGSQLHEAGLAPSSAEAILLAEGDDGSGVPLRSGLLLSSEYARVMANKSGLYVVTSLSVRGLGGGPNVYPPGSPEECRRRIGEWSDALLGLGLTCDLCDEALSRVDLAKDVPHRAGYEDLGEALLSRGFGVMSPTDERRFRPHEQGRTRNRMQSQRSFAHFTSNRGQFVYNKTGQLASGRRYRAYAEAVREGLGGADVVRFECRFMNANAVRTGLAARVGSDLFRRWDRLADRLDAEIVKNLGPTESSGKGRAPQGPDDSEPVGGQGGRAGRLDLAALVEARGRGKSTVMVDLALEALAARERDGIGRETLFERYRKVGVRPRDITAALGELDEFMTGPGGSFRASALSEFREALARPAYDWPSFSCPPDPI